MCHAACPFAPAKLRSYVNHRKFKKKKKKNVVEPQNQFPRQKIKNRDVANGMPKYPGHLGRGRWAN